MLSLKTKLVSALSGAFAALAFLASQAWAIPSLQIYVDPTLNPDARYDSSDDSWIVDWEKHSFTLSLFVLDADLGSEEGDAFPDIFQYTNFDLQTAVFFSMALQGDGLPPATPEPGLPSMKGAFGGGMEFVSGNPPFFTYNGWPGIDLPLHGVFPAWYLEGIVRFDPNGAAPVVFDALDPTGSGLKTGWRTEIVSSGLDLIDEVTSLHFDAYTMEEITNPQNPQESNLSAFDIYAYAPFTHDVTIRRFAPDEPVPEPATMLLMGSGLLALAGVKKFRGK